MSKEEDAVEPDWETPLSLALTPALLIHALMHTASTVHNAAAADAYERPSAAAPPPGNEANAAHMAAPMHSRPTTKALFRLPTGATRKVKA